MELPGVGPGLGFFFKGFSGECKNVLLGLSASGVKGGKQDQKSEERCEENRTENVVWPRGSQREGTVLPPRRHLAASGGTAGRHNWREGASGI